MSITGPPSLPPLDAADLTQDLALHGFSLRVPKDWDVLVNKGHWDGGHLVLAAGRVPRVNLTWERRGAGIDVERTVRKLGRTLPGTTPAPMQSIAGGGQLIRFQGPDVAWHVAILRPDPDRSLNLIVRQLIPGPSDDLRLIAGTAKVHDGEETVPWTIHHLDVRLAPEWRLTGISHMVGLVRAVWFHHPGGQKHKSDQVVVLRRFACASRLVTDGSHGSLSEWVGSRLAKREKIVDHQHQNGVSSFTLEGPPNTLWKRLRGKRQQRTVHAWVEPAMDRLMIQEWNGNGTPIPPLRRDRADEDAASHQPSEVVSP